MGWVSWAHHKWINHHYQSSPQFQCLQQNWGGNKIGPGLWCHSWLERPTEAENRVSLLCQQPLLATVKYSNPPMPTSSKTSKWCNKHWIWVIRVTKALVASQQRFWWFLTTPPMMIGTKHIYTIKLTIKPLANIAIRINVDNKIVFVSPVLYYFHHQHHFCCVFIFFVANWMYLGQFWSWENINFQYVTFSSWLIKWDFDWLLMIVFKWNCLCQLQQNSVKSTKLWFSDLDT